MAVSLNYSKRTPSLVEAAKAPFQPQAETLTYEPFFGLTEKPFSLIADSRFVYDSPTYASTFSSLIAGIRRREGLLVLTGQIGTGKTTLCRAVLEELGRNTYSSLVPDPFASREDLLKMMLIDFGALSVQELTSGPLRQATRTELGYLLSEFLNGLARDAFVVVIIDEAQNLSLPLIEETRILADTFGARGRLQIVFVGQPELHAKLKAPEMRQVDQRVCGYHRLEPMSRDAVGGYIEHRLQVAGRQDDRKLFDPAIVDVLHQRSGGVPRLINRICDRALQIAFERQVPAVDRAIIDTALLEVGSATLSPTWDSIVFADPAPLPTVASEPELEVSVPETATAPVAPVAPEAADPWFPADDEVPFKDQVDEWVNQDLAEPTRKPTPPAARQQASKNAPAQAPARRAVKFVRTPDPRFETRMQKIRRTWTKRAAIAAAGFVVLNMGMASLSLVARTFAEPELPETPESPAAALAVLPPPVGEPAELRDGDAPSSDEPASDEALNAVPASAAPVSAAPAAAPVSTAAVSTAPVSAAPVSAASVSAAPVNAAPVSGGVEEYLVAVGLFSSHERADTLADVLSQAGLPTMQRTLHLRGRQMQQVVLGPFLSADDAAADLRRLHALGGYRDARVFSIREP